MEAKLFYKNLKVYQEAKVIVNDVYKLMKKFPGEERFALCDQIRRAIVSVPSNIVEGLSRTTDKEKRNFPLTYSDENVHRILNSLHLISDDGRVTNAALLLFAKDPQKWFVSSTVKCVQFYGTKVQKPLASQQIYGGSVFEVVDQAVSFVMSHIDARVGERTASAQVDVEYELPVQAVTETIVNAVVHRDYLSTGSVQVMLFKDRLEVWNPGRLPKGMTVEKLNGEHASLPVNPLLANPVYLAGYIEQVGTGTNDVIDRCVELGLRKPEFRQDEDFMVTLWRKEGSGTVQSDPEVIQSDPERSKTDPNLLDAVYDLIKENHAISRAELARRLETSERQVRKAIDELRDKKIRRKGGDSGEWEIIG